jgi:quercetin dioxygenase-like cupin family protein
MAIRLPIQRTPTEGRTIAVVGDIYRFLATGDETDGRYTMWEAIVPPGGGPPPHIHSREEESFFILEGEITFQVGDKRIIAQAGTFANMPVGSLHSFKNATNKMARMIISIAPAGLERMFFEVGQPVALGEQPPPPSQAEIEKLLAVAASYGVEIRVPGH